MISTTPAACKFFAAISLATALLLPVTAGAVYFEDFNSADGGWDADGEIHRSTGGVGNSGYLEGHRTGFSPNFNPVSGMAANALGNLEANYGSSIRISYDGRSFQGGDTGPTHGFYSSGSTTFWGATVAANITPFQNDWTSVSFDINTNWSDAGAAAYGWIRQFGTDSWAATLHNVGWEEVFYRLHPSGGSGEVISGIDNFRMEAIPPPAHATTIETVPVGNPGNAADTTGFGAVPDLYFIGKYEVTNNQYAEFLNAVDPTASNTLQLFKTDSRGLGVEGIALNTGAPNGEKYVVASGLGNYPHANVSLYDTLRFANWLNNGQGNSDTESGAYTLLGSTPVPSNTPTRNTGARWFVPNENEWYKAAYHKNDGVTGNYWEYPTASDTEPFSDQPPGSGAPVQSNTANFYKDDSIANGYNDGFAATGSPVFNSSLNYLTEVGAYTASASPYGTFDQAGNLFEITESGQQRGGAMHIDDGQMAASERVPGNVTLGGDFRYGFRIARRILDYATAGPTDPAFVADTRPGNGGLPAPPATITFFSLDLLSGSSFTLDPHETLVLTGGPLFIGPGAVFSGNGIIQGNVINAGLLRIPIVHIQTVTQTSGGHVEVELPEPSMPGGAVSFSGDGMGVGEGTLLSFSPPAGEPSTPSVTIMGTPAPNAGTIRFDASLEVTGSFEQRETGALRLFIAGHDMPGVNYSQLTVGESVTLAGAIELVMEPELFNEFGYAPTVGDTFDLIQAAQGITIANSGLTLRSFSTQAGAPLITNLTFSTYHSGIAADPDHLLQIGESIFRLDLMDNDTILRATLIQRVDFVPEPSALLLLGLGAAIISVWRRL